MRALAAPGRSQSRAEPPKLDIKKDTNGMVFVKGSVIKDVHSEEDVLALFEQGNAMRHVGATKMNAESSRSHCVFSMIISLYDKPTKKVGRLPVSAVGGASRRVSPEPAMSDTDA